MNWPPQTRSSSALAKPVSFAGSTKPSLSSSTKRGGTLQENLATGRFDGCTAMPMATLGSPPGVTATGTSAPNESPPSLLVATDVTPSMPPIATATVPGPATSDDDQPSSAIVCTVS